MKKFSLILISIFLLLFSINCGASVYTYTRNNDNLYLPDDVEVTSKNINNILSTPAVNSSEKIYDYADLFSVEEEISLYEDVNNYINNSKMDLVIVTVADLGGKELEDYAYNFYDYNDFLDEGIVFVIHKEKDTSNLFMGNSGNKGSKIFNIYTDARINETLSYIYEDIKKEEYYSATRNYIKIVNGFYEKNSSSYKLDENGNFIKIIPWFELIIISLSLTFVIVMLLFFKTKNSLKTKYSDYLKSKIDDGSLIIRTDLDEEIVDDKKNEDSIL
ncbi:MAG: TPM domain-containing protein [Bacilli bacterium]|nr:TPM domain-containing protein [Bacilli bacterium]